MAIDTQPTDLADLRRDLISRLRDATGVTATNDLADRYLNISLHDIHTTPGGQWPWAIRRAVLLTHAVYSTGTVEITDSARTTVTGTGTAWNTAVTGMGFNNTRQGGKMTFAGSSEVYEVSSVASDMSITLVDRYISNLGTGLAAASSYIYFEDEYALAADFFRPVDFREFSGDLGIPLIGEAWFRRRYPRNSTTGVPKLAAIFQKGFASSTSPRYRVVFHPAPDAVHSVPYTYVTSNLAVTAAGAEQTQLVNDTDEPIIPLRYRHMIIFHALYHWYRDRKDDARSAEARAEYVDLVKRVANETQIGQDRPRLRPLRRSLRYGPMSSGRFDVNDRFDRLEDRWPWYGR